jgi:hypothetical protein
MVDKVASFDELFTLTASSPYPAVITNYLQDEICIETVVILDQLTGFMKRLNVTDTIVWPEVSKKIRKYGPFVRFDKTKAKETVLKVFTS